MNKNKSSTYLPTFVKWAGGKNQLIEQFKNFFPEKIDGYIEPFVGGGAVFFYVKANFEPQKIILSDTNEELINSYEVIRDDVDCLIDLLKQHREKHCKEYYYDVRQIDADVLSKIEKAARFIYLNKTCFNGLYRVNSRGKFNVPMGSYKNPSIFKEKELRQASNLLKGVELKTCSFEHIIDFAEEGDFIYLDPPYHPVSRTANFTSYTSDSFSESDQIRLAETYKKLDARGCRVMLSNSDTPFINELYKDFTIHTVKAKRMINCDATKRGAINEVVVLNYETPHRKNNDLKLSNFAPTTDLKCITR
jgi:DNA adenine methylase